MIEDNGLTIGTIVKLAKEKRFPYQATVELLNACNFHCVHCYLPEHNNMGLSYTSVINIFEQLRRLGTISLVLTGGEILLRDDLISIISKARNMGFSVTLLSNASLLNETMIQKLANLYINSYITTVFSLDESVNDKITGTKGSLSPILENLELLRKYNIRTVVNTPLMKWNWNSYRDLTRYCQDRNILYTPSPLITKRDDGNDDTVKLRLNDEQYEIVFDEIESLLTENSLLNTDFNIDGYPCETIRSSLDIDCEGNVFPCISLRYKVGNVLENSLEDIWYNSKQYEFINSIRNSDLKECCDCSLRNTCTRCPGRALLEDGSLFGCSSLDKRYAVIYTKKKDKVRAN